VKTMTRPLHRRPAGRIVTVFVVIALLATVCGALYIFLERRLRPAAARLAAGQLSRESVLAELSLLLLVLLASVLVILVFVIGAYLLIRVGQAVMQKPAAKQPTPYVDAWSQYRLTEEQTEAATGGGPDDSETEPDDEQPDNPPNDPNRPDSVS